MEHYTFKLPAPLIERMSYMYAVLSQFEAMHKMKVSSTELGEAIGQAATTVRKDIHYIGYKGAVGIRYNVAELRSVIGTTLGFSGTQDVCIVGLGTLGCALLNYFNFNSENGLNIVAGFDSNINRLETIKASIELFPAYRIEEVIKKKAISMAIIAVPPSAAQEVIDRCCDGGVSGIVNFSPICVSTKNNAVTIRSFDLASELRILTAHAYLAQ